MRPPNALTRNRAASVSPAKTAGDARIRIEYRSLRELVPYVRNARTHTPEQLGKLRVSLARFGWTNPMLIAGNEMIAGHARLAAAIGMATDGIDIPGNAEPWEGPTVDLSHLTPAERRAYIIADNRLAEDAGWDYDLLRVEMADLQVGGFDLSLTGFNLEEIGGIMVPPGAAEEEPDRELTEAENEMLDVAWRGLLAEWQDIFATAASRAWITTTFTKSALAVHYLRALFLGREIPRGGTLAYTPHRAWTSANQGAMQEAIPAGLAENGRSIRNGIRFICGEKPLFDTFCSASSLPVHGFRAPNDFPADLARDLIDEFSPTATASILDPCHGWGGRMLGFLLSDRATDYHGIDTSPLSHAGVQAMFNDLAGLTPHRTKRATLTMAPFETVALDAESYDFALTSPPYYDTEQYEGDGSSWRSYATFDAWVQGFYDKLIGNTAAALKPRGIFALQVGSQTYPLTKLAVEYGGKHGMTHVETRPTGMANNWAGTDPDQGEVVVLLRKA